MSADQPEAVETVDSSAVDPKELLAQIKDWRTGRATKSLWEALQDTYVVVLAVAVFGAMIIAAIFSAQTDAASCTTGACVSARTLVPWAVVAGVAALAISVARLFGPVVASAAEGFWLLDAPINRARLLRGRLTLFIVIAGVVGAALGALAAALTGSDGAVIGAWAAACGLAAAGLVAFAAAEQGAERRLPTRIAGYLFSAAAVAALILVVAIAAGWLQLVVGMNQELQIALIIAGLALLLLIISAVLAGLRLGSIRRTHLTSGGSLVSGMAGAMYALDFGLAHDMVVEREALERGHVRPARGRGVGVAQLFHRDLQRLLRKPSMLLPIAATIVIPYATSALGMGRFAPIIAGLALFAAMIPIQNGLRVLTRTSGLARCLPYTDGQIKATSIEASMIVGGVWAVATIPAFLGIYPDAIMGIVAAVCTAAAGVLGAARWTTAKPVDYGAPMLATGAGALPPGLIFNLLRGFEVVLLITALLVFNLPWYLPLAAVGLVYFFVIHFKFDMDEMREQQAEQQKRLAAERAKR